MALYYRIENPQEGDLVQYLGCYVLRWPPAPGTCPRVAFAEISHVQQQLYDAAPELLEASKEALDILDDLIFNKATRYDSFTLQPLKQAIAKAESATNDAPVEVE